MQPLPSRGVRSTVLALCLALISPARAEEPHVLPARSQVVYGGVGVSTFQYGSSGLIRDRVWFVRLDTYGAIGLSDRVQLAAAVPVVHASIREIDDRGPCPSPDDYCDPVTTVGDVGLEVRVQVVEEPVELSVAIAPHSNVWNRSTRHRFDAVGYGETGVALRAVVGRQFGAVRPVAWIVWDWTAGPVPLDAVRGGVEVGAIRWGFTGLVGVHAELKLGGEPYGPVWIAQWYPTDDRWAALRYQAVKIEAKLSRELGEHAGVHLSVTGAVWTRSGPRDLLDVSLGVHRYWP